ncbi:MAG: aminoglycoside phosphotransferase [Acidimicrobiales bacterium]|nr:aminoglycoside phosphotransferase [Acidimicrobiales bacterium]
MRSEPGLGRSSSPLSTVAIRDGSVTTREEHHLDQVRGWMDAEAIGTGPLTEVELLTGGTQNILIRFRRNSSTYVLRRPPVHKRPNSDDTMRREAVVLRALAGTDVPHPRLIRACPDETVIGAAFYLMESIEGFNVREGLAAHVAADADAQRAMGLSMVDAFAKLGRIDHRAVGLGEFGRPDGWLERQVPRWLSHLTSFADLEGYTGAALPDVLRVADWLSVHQPSTWSPGVIHGDVHFGNVLVSNSSPRLTAIVDWELATIGDPLLDLGHLLIMWPRQDYPALWNGPDIPGLPRAAEIIQRYEETSGRRVPSATWYCVLACFRLGIILEGTYARSLAGFATIETGLQLHSSALALMTIAGRLIDGSLDVHDL